MFRRLSVIAVVVLATQAGCRSRCDSRPGFFSSHTRGPAPCQTVGRNGGCFDAATGQPVPCPTEGTGMVIPNGAGPALPGPAFPGPAFPNVGPRPDELHMPNPSTLIPSPAVPVPAPGDASLPFPSSGGTPVRTGPK